MSGNYARVLIRVAILCSLLAGAIMVSRPQPVLASTCTECVSDCFNEQRSCALNCEATGGTNCDAVCNPSGLSCRQQCTNEGLCP